MAYSNTHVLNRRTFIGLAAAAAAAGCGLLAARGGAAQGAAIAQEGDVVDVVDFAGRTVAVNTASDKIATIAGPAYEKVFMLGEADRIVATMAGGSFKNKWANALNPNLKDLFPVGNPDDPNIEELVAQGVETVFHFNNPEVLNKMAQVGLSALAVLPGADASATDVDGFVKNLKDEVHIYGKALGARAEAKAQEWCDYFDEKLAYVRKALEGLGEDEVPSVHIVGGSNILGCFTQYSYPDFYVQMAGGRLVTGTSSEGTFAMEQMYAWDPDIIFMGRQASKDVIMDDPAWQPLTAVKEDNVHITPNGVFFWDYDSEGILLVMYMAQKMHPERFEDLDMAAEVAYYYEHFYGCELTDDEVARILAHQDPEEDEAAETPAK